MGSLLRQTDQLARLDVEFREAACVLGGFVTVRGCLNEPALAVLSS